MEGIYTKKGTKLSAHILTTQRESLNLMIFFFARMWGTYFICFISFLFLSLFPICVFLFILLILCDEWNT